MAELRPRLDQRAALRQHAGLAPALQQSIKLLEMSNLALAELVAEAVAENPLLDVAAELPGPPPVAVARQPRRPSRREAALPLPAGLARLWSTVSRGQRSAEGTSGETDSTAELPAEGPSLHEHLLQQLGADIADPIDQAIGRAFIEAVDEAGYLTADPQAIATQLRHPPVRVAAVLARLQAFDPPGVLARDLKECLALQLADRGRLDEPMRRLLDHLDLLAKGDRVALMQRCSVDAAGLTALIDALRRLDPRPGLAFDRALPVTVTPDLSVERGTDGAWRVELNDRTLPRLTVNEHYPAARDAAAVAYIRERRVAAHWLVRALDRRAATLVSVASVIVQRQAGFLEGGDVELRPLSRREIAVALSLHESTISRATANKYVATPRGVLALADFFDGRLGTEAGTVGHAPAAVRVRLRRLVGAEPASRPLSDEDLAELLRAEGIDIARRTVAKYREMLRIASSFRRRRRETL
jgi:RNA polymerase sigma-54 factor